MSEIYVTLESLKDIVSSDVYKRLCMDVEELERFDTSLERLNVQVEKLA